MSGELLAVRNLAGIKTLVSSGSSISNNSISGASASSYDVDSDGGGYPDGEPILVGSFATAPTEGSFLSLYAQPKAIDGTSGHDTEAPETTRATRLIGSFAVNNVTSTQYMQLQGSGIARDLPKNADYYLHNNGTGQTLSSGWSLYMIPRTVKPA